MKRKLFRSLAFFLLFVTVLSLHPFAASFDKKEYQISAKEDVKEFLNQCLSDHDRAVLEHFSDEENPYIKAYPLPQACLFDENFFSLFTEKEAPTAEEIRKEAEKSPYLAAFIDAYSSIRQSEEILPQPNLENAVVLSFQSRDEISSELYPVDSYGHLNEEAYRFSSVIDYYTLTPEGSFIIVSQRVSQDGVTYLWQETTTASYVEKTIDKETGEVIEIRESYAKGKAYLAKEFLDGGRFYTDEAGVLCLRKNSSPLKDLICFQNFVFYETQAGLVVEKPSITDEKSLWWTFEEFQKDMKGYQTFCQWAEFLDVSTVPFISYVQYYKDDPVQSLLDAFESRHPAKYYTFLTGGILLILAVVTIVITAVITVRTSRKKKRLKEASPSPENGQ